MKYTYKELVKVCDDFFNSLSDEAQCIFLKNVDVTFDMYVLSNIYEGDIVWIDYENNDYIIINKKQHERKQKIKKLIK